MPRCTVRFTVPPVGAGETVGAGVGVLSAEGLAVVTGLGDVAGAGGAAACCSAQPVSSRTATAASAAIRRGTAIPFRRASGAIPTHPLYRTDLRVRCDRSSTAQTRPVSTASTIQRRPSRSP